MLYGLYGLGLNRTVEDQIDAFELGEYRDVKFENLSTGLKQRLSLAKAMLNHPSLLFFWTSRPPAWTRTCPPKPTI